MIRWPLGWAGRTPGQGRSFEGHVILKKIRYVNVKINNLIGYTRTNTNIGTLGYGVYFHAP
ncbi:hypothetical protein HanRHA438_Chr14g0632861 [Helianthus annuus]|nr:hypothetical protein HanRHA438_Chr14g0632861 [Helianthus annuus]